MSRQERENMITFLTKVQGFTEGKLMMMTDADIEHLYTRAYILQEKN
ncbi:BH0509 family protein [Halalkalibacter akibai]|nr:BH0509 family protein [Halalkalibacter akibai]